MLRSATRPVFTGVVSGSPELFKPISRWQRSTNTNATLVKSLAWHDFYDMEMTCCSFVGPCSANHHAGLRLELTGCKDQQVSVGTVTQLLPLEESEAECR